MRVLTAGGAKPIGETLTAGGAAPSTGGSGGGSGGGGAKIEVLNKTGAVINQGDKVWLSENVQEAGSSYTVGSGNVNSTANSYIDRTGNFAVFNGAMYSVDSEKLTSIGNAPQQYINLLYYDDDNSVVFYYNSYIYRVDSNMQFSKSAAGYYGDGFITTSGMFSGGGYPLYKINMTDGKTLKTYALPYSTKPTVVIGDIVYIISSPLKYYDLTEGEYPTTILTEKTGTLLNNTVNRSANLVGVTADKRYIITCTLTYAYNNGYLTMYEVVSKTQLRQLSMSEMPEDLQAFYGTKGSYTFNPYTGVLTATASEGTSYAVVKYENGEWTKIPVDLPAFNRKFYGYLTVSDDLSRAMVVCQNGGYTQSYIVNLTTLDGYTAIPYKPYAVNENTITATALAESQPNEPTQVQIGSVTNETLTVTENGKYTPSATYTGFGSVNVNVKGAEKIEAVNKTGSVINEGDKVLLSKNATIGNSSYVFSSGNTTFGSYGFIDQTGLVGYGKDGKYSLGEKEATQLTTTGYATVYHLRYTDTGNIMFTQRVSSSEGNFTNVLITPTGEVAKTFPNIIGSNGYYYNSGALQMEKYNTDTQELEMTWTDSALPSSYSTIAVMNKIVYYYYSNKVKYRKLYDDGTTSALYDGGYEGTVRYVSGCFAITLDEKYALCINNVLNDGFDNDGSELQFIKSVNDSILKFYTEDEMPTDLQKYGPGSGAKGMYTFNPKNGILTACLASTQIYDIVKYENETWTKLPVELNLEGSEIFLSAITFSEDLTRACVRTSNGAKVFNLENNSGYSALKYSANNVNESSITGNATMNVEPNEKFIASVVLPKEVEVTLTTEKDNIDMTME